MPAASYSDQQTSDCISGVFVWPTPWASAASAPRNEAPDQGQTFPRLTAASHCWPARSSLTVGKTAGQDFTVKLVWLARRERHQGRARQVEGHFWDQGMSATTTGGRYRDSWQGKRDSGVEPKHVVKGDGLARCHQQARQRALLKFGGPATTVKTARPPRNKAHESRCPLPSEKHEASQSRDDARFRMTREQANYPPVTTNTTFPAAAVQLSPPRRRSAEAYQPETILGRREALLPTELDTALCKAIASGDRTSAGHGKAGEG